MNAAEDVFAAGYGWVKGDGGFVDLHLEEVPQIPSDVWSKEDRTDAEKAEIREFYNKTISNQNTRAKVLGYQMQLRQAWQLKDEECHYYVASLDFRGRIYLRGQFLHPQSNTFCKGVIQFARPKPLGNKGFLALKRFVASFVTGGDLSDADMSKASVEEQIAWTDANIDNLRKIVLDPSSYWNVWGKTDSPFEFLGAAKDLIDAIDCGDPENWMSHIIVRIDAVCSGIQHCSSLVRDKQLAESVCLVGQERGEDIYMLVAKECNKMFDERDFNDRQLAMLDVVEKCVGDAEIMKRSDCKNAVMQRAYAVSKSTIGERLKKSWGERHGLKDACKNLFYRRTKQDGETVDELITPGKITYFLAETQFAALGRFSKSLMKLLNFFRLVAIDRIQKDKPYQWTNPGGFTVIQSYIHMDETTINTAFGGLKLQRPARDSQGNTIQKESKAKNAVSANTIHSLDSCLLVFTGQRFDHDLSVIHDSTGCHACNVEEMFTALKESHVEIYDRDILGDMLKQMEIQSLVLPVLAEDDDNYLDIQDVKKSGFYFC